MCQSPGTIRKTLKESGISLGNNFLIWQEVKLFPNAQEICSWKDVLLCELSVVYETVHDQTC